MSARETSSLIRLGFKSFFHLNNVNMDREMAELEFQEYMNEYKPTVKDNDVITKSRLISLLQQGIAAGANGRTICVKIYTQHNERLHMVKKFQEFTEVLISYVNLNEPMQFEIYELPNYVEMFRNSEEE